MCVGGGGGGRRSGPRQRQCGLTTARAPLLTPLSRCPACDGWRTRLIRTRTVSTFMAAEEPTKIELKALLRTEGRSVPKEAPDLEDGEVGVLSLAYQSL